MLYKSKRQYLKVMARLRCEDSLSEDQQETELQNRNLGLAGLASRKFLQGMGCKKWGWSHSQCRRKSRRKGDHQMVVQMDHTNEGM
jgi:hypothetical protein